MSWFGKAESSKKKADNAVKKYRERNPKGELPRALQRNQQLANQDFREAEDNRKEAIKARKSSKTKNMRDKLDGKNKKR